MDRRFLAMAMAFLTAIGAWYQSRDGGGSVSPSTTSAIAESIHRNRAKRQAVVYRDAITKVESGEFTTGADLGRYLVSGVAAIETDVTSPLSEDAAKVLPSGEITDPDAAKRWLESAAKGFDQVGK